MNKKGKGILVFLCLFLLVSFFAHAQTTEIRGKVTSPEGEALPGVEVTLTSPNLIGGDQSRITDAEGKFRFVALLPGTYAVEAKLEGFTPQKRPDLRLSSGKTLTADVVLEIGSLEEQVTVVAEAPIIDLKDSQTVTTTFKTEFLQKLPIRGVESALNMTPGVSGLSAFGSAESNSNNYLIGGVKVNDPEGGEQGLSLAYDSIEEISVMGVGAPAEYGGYSGAIVNSVMKSGGNNFHGMGTFYMQLPGFDSENWGDYGEDFKRRRYSENYDVNFNLGGPIIRDKLWFFTSVRYGYDQDHQEGYTGPTEGFRGGEATGKLTWQASTNDRISLWAGGEPAKILNYGFEPDWMAPETNTNENHRNFYFNANYLHTFSDVTFLEAKVGGFRNKGENEVDKDGDYAHFELTDETLSGNYPWTYYRTAVRIQTNIALSHHAEDFIIGDHDFKLGAEIEFSEVNIQYYYPGGKFYYDYDGADYYFLEWDGEQGRPKIRTYTGFVQDSWEVSDRLVINPGLRINHWRGYVPGVSGAVFAPKTGFAPRIGITFDVFGDNSTALKAHYGKYYHGLFGQFFFRLQPQGGLRQYAMGWAMNMWAEDAFIEEGDPYPDDYPWDDDKWVLDWEDTWESEYTMDPDIKMAYMNSYVIGIEREIVKDVSVGASFIYRTNHDMQDRVNILGEWNETTWTCDYPGPFFGNTYTVYARTNPGENQYYLTNPKEGEDYDQAFDNIVAFTPTRKYRGVQFTFEKRYSNGWMLSASYVWGKAWGTDDNSFYDWAQGRGSMFGSSTMYSNPNNQINADGPLSMDPTHQVKIFGAVDIPVVDVTLGLSYNYTSGDPYSSELQLPGWMDDESIYIFGEERGTYRYKGMHDLDLRIEKFFRIGNIRVGVLADLFNAFNDDTETWLQTEMRPGLARDFGEVRGIRGPRTFRIAFRFEF